MRAFLFAAAFVIACQAVPARAQTHVCTGGPAEGQSMIGEQDVGGGVRVPICTSGGNGSGGGDGEGPYARAARERAEASAAYSNTLREASEAMRGIMARQAELNRINGITPEMIANAPPVEDRRRGAWTFGTNAYCGAAFYSGYGLVSITTPARGQPGVYLTFWSSNIPRPATVTPVRARLSQTGDTAPQTVRAINYNDAAMNMGAIVMAVPSIDALLDNILDVHEFRMWIGDTPAVYLQWQNGLAARDRLRACLTRTQS